MPCSFTRAVSTFMDFCSVITASSLSSSSAGSLGQFTRACDNHRGPCHHRSASSSSSSERPRLGISAGTVFPLPRGDYTLNLLHSVSYKGLPALGGSSNPG
ncbi:hypothetical protein T11_11315 [Trichinella zimbabwensis]|uniref:Uncharacterized protein n=2 Tax=Trichinella TaxID=6333 RepID=A0A0V1N8U9_9BILA|nr:hypothetical protein T11_17686 [Trichinella zimbabwensis]KRZ04087.1 hypothetical protein T11_13491 [Trichinella zimbabwensis]KRZ17275.1 hypothetical protein T11_11315 [Trichinella zimbabwensis]KRZ80410.1 hypothetical protein T10_906 [Trichinella papuae]KRZ80541.1 hypothetical protein T10_9648 [Trichinella papuae]